VRPATQRSSRVETSVVQQGGGVEVLTTLPSATWSSPAYPAEAQTDDDQQRRSRLPPLFTTCAAIVSSSSLLETMLSAIADSTAARSGANRSSRSW
jgi:hypothetical protein